MSKFEIMVYATFFGWFLSQLTECIKYYWRMKSKKNAVTEEMYDLKELLKEGAKLAKEAYLKWNPSNGVIRYSLGEELPTQVFNSFYHDIADKFTKEQRFNIRMFQTHLNIYNENITWVKSLKSGETKDFELRFKFFNSYQNASLCIAFLEACEVAGGREKLTNNHPLLKKLKIELDEVWLKLGPKGPLS